MPPMFPQSLSRQTLPLKQFCSEETTVSFALFHLSIPPSGSRPIQVGKVGKAGSYERTRKSNLATIMAFLSPPEKLQLSAIIPPTGWGYSGRGILVVLGLRVPYTRPICTCEMSCWQWRQLIGVASAGRSARCKFFPGLSLGSFSALQPSSLCLFSLRREAHESKLRFSHRVVSPSFSPFCLS